MKRILSLLTLLTAAFVQLSADKATINPQASPEAVVTSGRARFTVLTPQMIRIQWSTRQNFEDRATFAVVNRNLPVPSFTTHEEDGYLYIQTEALTLRYKVGSTISPLMKSPNNLSITMPLNGHDVVWYPGKEDALNLKGTRRTLDGGSGDNYRPDMEDGIISRAGWAVIDESPRTKRGDGSTKAPRRPSINRTTKNDKVKVFQHIGSTWNKVFQKFSVNETLCFSLRNTLFLPPKQSVSSTDTVIGTVVSSK